MKYLKLFERDEDTIYNRTSDTLYDAPGVAYIKDVDKVIYAPFDLNQKYYIDENYNAVLYRESYIDIVNNSETINITGISSPIVKTINFTFENITSDNIEIVLSGTDNVTSSEIILDGNSGSFDITYTPVDYDTESVQVYLKSYNINNTEELISSNIVTFNYVVEEELDYLTFTMLDNGTFSIRDNLLSDISNEGIDPLDLKYSINKGEWKTYDINTEINLKANDNIRLKGNNEYFSIIDGSDIQYIRVFNIKGYYNVSGHIISLLSEDLQYNKELPFACFTYAFQDYFKLLEFNENEMNSEDIEWVKENLKGVVDASKLILPESLSMGIYRGMFYYCTNLTNAPKLLATTLKPYCYESMFSGCISLVESPELLTETLSDYCYSYMFEGCTNLTTAPELPVTTLTNNCYNYMFEGCTSLTTPPELPATTLANSCYKSMFSGCTSLTEAPELLAETLSDYCYSDMFEGCTSLTKAYELPAEILTSYCYYNMFSGCTSLSEAPKLPSKTLYEGCYEGMFSGCTSLNEAPELPATTLENYCYSNMFNNCTSLNYIKVCFTNWNTINDYIISTDYWVLNVSSEGIFECPEELTLQTGVSYIPEGWAVPSKGSIVISNKEELETPITIEPNTTQSFTINTDLQQLTLENCSVTSSNSKFTIGTKENNSIVVNFKSNTSGTFTSTITVSDNTYNTGKSDSVVLTVNVPEPEKSYYLRYGVSNNNNYSTWTNEVEGKELANGNIIFEPLTFTTSNNFIAITTKANDIQLSTNVYIKDFVNNDVNSLCYSSGYQEYGGKHEYRFDIKQPGDYSITANLSNKTLEILLYTNDPVDPDEPVEPDEPVDPSEDTPVKVASYNIRYWNGDGDTGNADFRAWPNRKAKVFEMIRKHDMDVCGLQEVTQQMSPDIIRELTEYTYVGYGRDNGLENSESSSTGEQTGLIYKKDKFNELDRGRFFLSNTPNSVSRVPNSMFNRLATWVKLQDKETLKEFIFASTHFDHPTDSSVADLVREQQAQYAVSNILSIAGNLPIFFVGDFNSESNTTAYSVLTSTFNDSYNFLTVPEGGYVCNLEQINSGKCPGCSEIGNTYTGLYSSSDIDPKRIDFVLYLSDKSSQLSYLVDTDNLGLEYYPSDHLPVVCDMLI